jgi:hypothetical protein
LRLSARIVQRSSPPQAAGDFGRDEERPLGQRNRGAL